MKTTTKKTTKKAFKGYGLLPLPEDKRDLKHSQVFGSAPVPSVTFDVISVSRIKNQHDSDMCAAFSVSSINEDMQKQEFCPLYQFAKIKQVMGDYKGYGADLRSACKSVVKYGSIRKSISPYVYDPSSPLSKDRDFIANWLNWPPALDTMAGEFRCGSYFAVDGGGDHFDNIVSTLWLNRNENRGVEFGVMWRPEWTYVQGGVIPEATYQKPEGYGHAVKAVGQKIINGKPYVIVQNSWGENMGDSGFYYFPRSVINKEVAMFGAYTLKDMDVETAKTYIAYNLTTQDGAIAMIVKIIISLYNDFKKLLS